MTSINEIAKNIVAENTKYGYEPIYFDQGYIDTDDQVISLFLQGDDSWRELAYSALDQGYEDSVWHDARTLAKENIDHEFLVAHDVDEYDLADVIRVYLYDACTQDYAYEWVRRMRNPAVRIQIDNLIDPEFVANSDGITPEILLKQAGIAASEKNLVAAQSIINEAMSVYGGSYYNLFLVFQLDLADIKDTSDKVRIVGDVELWATNVYQGDGWAETVHVDMVINRSLFATDNEAAGYSYCEVFGTTAGYLPSPTISMVSTQEQQV